MDEDPHLDNRIAKRERFNKASCRPEERNRRKRRNRTEGLEKRNFNWSQDQQGIARAPRTHSVTRTAHEIDEKSSYKEHRVDAKAPSAEEGRGKLRKVRGSRKQA